MGGDTLPTATFPASTKERSIPKTTCCPMSSSRLARHESFQRQVARGARKLGDTVLSLCTTAPADLLILMPTPYALGGRPPLLVEIKTLRKGTSLTKKPNQEALRLSLERPGAPEAIYLYCVRKEAVEGFRCEISSTPKSEWAEEHLRECVREGMDDAST
jgi:hypothetical protein